MRTSASSISSNEYNISFTCLLLNHVAFLRRIKTWMEVEEHPVAGASWTVCVIYHCWRYRSTLNYLDMALRSRSKSCTWRGSISFRTLGAWCIIVCFEGILIILMLLLPRRMIAVWWRSYHTSLLHLVLICPRRKPICSLLLSLHLCVASLASCIRISCGSCSVHFNLVLDTSSKVLLSLVHHLMMLDLISCHWASNLHCLRLV